VGLAVDGTLAGPDVDALSDAELAARVGPVTLFTRLNPEQKARVIRALRAAGHVVGYLGDGINDGPALRAADVGVSVDDAVDIARETADIILLEHSLLVLQEGVIEGRRVFGNVTKYLRMAGSSSFGNMLSVVGASALLPFVPMAPVQILLNNLLYDVSQTAVATDRVDAEYLAKPRRWDISGIGRYMIAIGPLSSIFDYATFALMAWGFGALQDSALFHTGWFVESLLSQTLIVHVIRTGRVPFVDSRPSGTLLAMTLAVCAFGVWLPFSPLAGALGLVPLPPAYWVALAAMLAAYLTLTQVVKTWLLRRLRLD
jgi:Mg2+-importing ATPase